MIDKEMEDLLEFFYGPGWWLIDNSKLTEMIESLNNIIAWE